MPYLQAAPETPTVSLSPDAEIPVLQNREPTVPDYSDRDYTFCHQPKAFRHAPSAHESDDACLYPDQSESDFFRWELLKSVRALIRYFPR